MSVMVVYKSVSPSLLSPGTGGEEWGGAENVPIAAPSLGKDPRRSEKKVGKGQGFTTGYGGSEVEEERRRLSFPSWPATSSGLRSGLERQSTEHASAVCVSS